MSQRCVNGHFCDEGGVPCSVCGKRAYDATKNDLYKRKIYVKADGIEEEIHLKPTTSGFNLLVFSSGEGLPYQTVNLLTSAIKVQFHDKIPSAPLTLTDIESNSQCAITISENMGIYTLKIIIDGRENRDYITIGDVYGYGVPALEVTTSIEEHIYCHWFVCLYPDIFSKEIQPKSIPKFFETFRYIAHQGPYCKKDEKSVEIFSPHAECTHLEKEYYQTKVYPFVDPVHIRDYICYNYRVCDGFERIIREASNGQTFCTEHPSISVKVCIESGNKNELALFFKYMYNILMYQPIKKQYSHNKERKSTMKQKTVGIILLVVGIMAFLGSVVNGSLVQMFQLTNLYNLISNMTTLILMIGLVVAGIILMMKGNNQK